MFFSFRFTLHWLFFHIVRDFGKWSELGSRDTDGQTREGERAGENESTGQVPGLESSTVESFHATEG
jgi:hypothetical protein